MAGNYTDNLPVKVFSWNFLNSDENTIPGRIRYCVPTDNRGFLLGINVLPENVDTFLSLTGTRVDSNYNFDLLLTKEDTAFLDGMTGNAEDRSAVVQGIVEFFKDMNLKIDHKIVNELELIELLKNGITEKN